MERVGGSPKPFGIFVELRALHVQAAADGLGLAYVLERRALQETERGALEIVMPQWGSTGPGFYAYYASRKQTQPSLRQLIDLVRKREGLA